MKWRDVVIGAISSLVVATLAGVVIYYLTKEPPTPTPDENLVYLVEKPVAFETTKTKFALFTVRAGNFGDLVATNVTVGITFDDAEIIDKKIALSSEPAGIYSVTNSTPSELGLTVPSLSPGETVVISLMLNREPDKAPTVAAKSNKSVGRSTTVFGQPITRPESRATTALKWILAILTAVVYIVGGVIAGRYIYFWRNYSAIASF